MVHPLLLVAPSMLFAGTVLADTSNEQLQKRLQEYEKRLTELEQQTESSDNNSNDTNRTTGNAFNPAVSIILDGTYASYDNDPEEYELPGYGLGGEAELAAKGFSVGHSELTLSNNIDDKFFGKFTVAIVEHEGEVEIELEEAFFETQALVSGSNVRAGRFFSAVGYLNQQHRHQWDFHDVPLVYRGIFGGQYIDDGLQLSYILPTDMFVELGAEMFAGSKFPAGGEHDGAGSWIAFINVGGDIGVSHSWQAGVSYWSADSVEREYNVHDDGGPIEIPVFEGDSDIVGMNVVYKWAPNGNYRDQNFKFQLEAFSREEQGDIILLDGDGLLLGTSTLNSEQDGWYTQVRWQFARNWAISARYDKLDSDNTGSDIVTLDEAGLVTNGHAPGRTSVATDWVQSEFSRIRLQFNRDDSYQDADHQVFVQYTMSIGAHGAHTF
jgi:hypothetical protein